MIPKDKVQEIISRHDTLEKELSSGNIDKKHFAEKSKRIFKSWKHHFICKRIYEI